MSGHSHWSGIKHKKGEKDQKRGVLFSKLLKAISAAAKQEPNPDFNPRLRTAVQKAEEASVPEVNIKRAISGAKEKKDSLEELFFEAYGPSGVAILIYIITSSRNRIVAEVKKILSDNNGKWAEIGSVTWAFGDVGVGKTPHSKFTQEASKEDKEELRGLIVALEDNEDVFGVYTNIKE